MKSRVMLPLSAKFARAPSAGALLFYAGSSVLRRRYEVVAPRPPRFAILSGSDNFARVGRDERNTHSGGRDGDPTGGAGALRRPRRCRRRRAPGAAMVRQLPCRRRRQRGDDGAPGTANVPRGRRAAQPGPAAHLPVASPSADARFGAEPHRNQRSDRLYRDLALTAGEASAAFAARRSTSIVRGG